ncbi:MAG: tetratricopeptide repeat protein [Comamonadaceae bacterium]|nr:tetratricopeptide repeat protein [Comamonadaceae bacterium]
MTKRIIAALFASWPPISSAFLAGPPPGGGTPGERLREEGDIPGAIAEFEKVYAQNPKDQKNVYNLARALSINRRFDECFRYLALAVDMEPSLGPLIDPDLLTARGTSVGPPSRTRSSLRSTPSSTTPTRMSNTPRRCGV